MSLSQYILDAREQHRLQIRERNTWLTRVRWFYLLLLTGVVTLTSTLANDNVISNRDFALKVCAIGIFINGILWSLTKFQNQYIGYYKTIAALQITLDITLASAVIYFQEGLASRATVLFAIPIIGAGLLFGKVFAYISVLVSAAAYAGTLYLYQQWNPYAYEAHFITLPAVFYFAVFLIIAVMISSYRTRTVALEREQSYTELLSLLRHQLHHPSGVIAALIDMLEHGEFYDKWPPGDKAYLQQLKRENKRQNTMISNALESISTDNAELTKTKIFDIVPLLNEEAVSCAMGAKRISDLVTKLPNKKIEVEGDPVQISIVLDNIISNAFRYTTKGTPVSVAVKEDNLKVTITVEDRGEGMSDEQQKRLFSLFSKLEHRVVGKPEEAEQLYSMGLGLYVSRLIVERHKGKFDLVSDKNGTKITITLYGRLV